MRISDWSSDVCSSDLPHPFEIVEAAHFGAEQVDDDVTGVDQHPIRGRQSFDPRGPAGLGLDLFGQLGRHRRDLARRAAAGDHHVICDRGFARSEEHTSELKSLMRTSYAVFCLKQTMIS